MKNTAILCSLDPSIGLQAHYFLGRMSEEVEKTVEMGYRYRLYEESTSKGEAQQARISFEEWNATTGAGGTK